MQVGDLQRTMTPDQWMRVNPWRAPGYGQIPSHTVLPRRSFQTHLCVGPKPVMTSDGSGRTLGAAGRQVMRPRMNPDGVLRDDDADPNQVCIHCHKGLLRDGKVQVLLRDQ